MSLSERIAALNARATNSNHQQPSKGGIQMSSAVKDKAARFDGLGPAPAPRGSFGLGAPPTSSPKRNNELYGNRISSLSGGALKASTGSHHSRASSSASDRPPSRNESHGSGDQALAKVPPSNPLTTEAVESLGTATFASPLTAHKRPYQSIASSEVDPQDASSSVAVEVDDVGTSLITSTDSTASGGGRASPAMTHSTVSDSAMREAPPILTPAPASPLVNSLPLSASQDELLAAATQDSTKSIPASSLASTLSLQSDQRIPPTSLVEDIASLQVSDRSPSPIPPPVTPLPLSAALIESLDSKDGPTPATPRSVFVEAGSDTEIDVDASEAQDTSLALFTEDSDPPQLGSDNEPSGEPIEVDLASNDGDQPIQPGLDIPAVVAPLSIELLSTHNLSSPPSRVNPASRTGYDTPYSTFVEDGSVDGRTLAESDQEMALAVDEEYIDPKGPNEMDSFASSQPALQTLVETPLHPPILSISSPPSPAVLAYDPNIALLTPTTQPGRHDSEALVNIGELASSGQDDASVGQDQHPPHHSASPSADSQINTPMATRVPLPDHTPVASREPEVNSKAPGVQGEGAKNAGTESQQQVQEEEASAVDSAFPLPKFSMSPDIDDNTDDRQNKGQPLTLEDSPILPEEHDLPSSEARQSYDPKQLYVNPPSPCSSISSSRPVSSNLEDTLHLIKSFPSIPPMRQPPSIFVDKPLPSPPAELAYLKYSPTFQPMTPSSKTPTRPTSATFQDSHTSPPGTAAINRRHSTDDLANTSKNAAPSLHLLSTSNATVRRSVSSGAVQKPSSKPRKKPQLIPGAWITDDDVMEDDFEPGWASITVTKYQYR